MGKMYQRQETVGNSFPDGSGLESGLDSVVERCKAMQVRHGSPVLARIAGRTSDMGRRTQRKGVRELYVAAIEFAGAAGTVQIRNVRL